ncbi:MAG: ATPase [Thermoprotei archaeon]|nr:MAG: ATPase [Thermoprotei archaeon]
MLNINTVEDVRSFSSKILENLGKVIIGLRKELKLILISLLADGHVLLEGVPGVAKTTIVRALVRLLGLDDIREEVINGTPFKGWSRIQFTPDLMPSDIIGTLVFNPSTRGFEPRFGPIFAYIVLADEINRAIPRTQSALLQAMQEREVVIGRRIYPLIDRGRGKFFFVLATQNPIEQEGTYPLPEAQLDRFLMKVIIPYPQTLEEEKEILRLHSRRLSEPLEDLRKVVPSPTVVMVVQEWIARNVNISEKAFDFITYIIRNTRPEFNKEIRDYILCGASPRAGIALMRAAKVNAALDGRTTVEPYDVEEVAYSVLNHRIILNPERVVEARLEDRSYVASYKVAEEAIEKILEISR